jgi:hypothetical protein
VVRFQPISRMNAVMVIRSCWPRPRNGFIVSTGPIRRGQRCEPSV